MFGNPQWFREKQTGWGVSPVSWQGWFCAAVWIGVIAIPFVALVVRQQGPEALIWLVASTALLFWEVASIRRTLRGPTNTEILYIGDDGESRSVPARPRRFRFSLKK